MLTLFPIYFLAPLAYTALRFCIAGIFAHQAIQHIRKRDSFTQVFTISIFPFPTFIIWYLIVVEITISTLMPLGAYTQIAALLAMLLAVKFIAIHKHFAHPLIPSRIFYILLLFASFSLFVTGAGAFAFDLPI